MVRTVKAIGNARRATIEGSQETRWVLVVGIGGRTVAVLGGISLATLMAKPSSITIIQRPY